MIAGLTGSLLSHDALGQCHVPPGAADTATSRLIAEIVSGATSTMGPATSARLVFDRLAAPLAAALGFDVALRPGATGPVLLAELRRAGEPVAAMVAAPWDTEPSTLWRDAVHLGIACGVRWCYAITGPALRVVDARQSYSRRFVEFDLTAVANGAPALAVFLELLRADSFETTRARVPALDRAILLSDAHRADVRASLQLGVQEALVHLVRAFATARGVRRPRGGLDRLFEESLIVVYRVLFLLFAEARALVPNWHPIYRDSYTIETLRGSLERLPRPGIWETLQAIARLAHRGCGAGTLRVPPFNGRLFSPVHAPLADCLPLDDGEVRQALVALTTRPCPAGRVPIAYSDLGVEQLGGVYERVLDFEPAAPGGDVRRLTLVRAERRKATGSYYTPRALTEFVIRRTLSPLVNEATPDEILSLRVLDPAMGSGAFLVAACRFLASAYENAAVRTGLVGAGDVDEDARAGFRRMIAQRCLYGVDLNPMAVQLGRLSLWLATLAADRPLTFLDHHLRTGNSLVGASLEDVVRAPAALRRLRERELPLFDTAAIDEAIASAVVPLLAIAREDGETIEQVRAKERLLASLGQDDAPLRRWKAVADLWCAGWFRERPYGTSFTALVDEILGRAAALPRHLSSPLLDDARSVAERERFFHWTLEFPECFHDSRGRALASPGFDAVVGNPPWEMLRGDRGSAAARSAAGESGARLTAFSRHSGVYRHQGDGHANLYQLFVERALDLTRRGGRTGLVLPSGFGSDHGCTALRRRVLDASAVDTFVSVENRDGLFPIHRSLRFLLVTATVGPPTGTLPCRFGVRSPEVLDGLPDAGHDGQDVPVGRDVIVQVTGDGYAIPEIRSAADLAIVSNIAFSTPALGESGWNLAFGRELNASDDRGYFVERPVGATRRNLLPVVEGKQIQAFTVDVARSALCLPARTAARLLDPDRTYRRARLAYRDVASATNRLTLIAAILPRGVVTTHTLFCLKAPLDDDVQQFLCGMFNSYVANYLVRLRVGTHVSAGIIARLRVPRPAPGSVALRRIAGLSRRLARRPGDRDAAARLQAMAAMLYRLTPAEFQHVLNTFPLVAIEDRARAMRAFLDAI